MLLFFDGKDESFCFSYEDMFEFVCCVGVVIYLIGFVIDGKGLCEVKKKLIEIVEEMGGCSFFFSDVLGFSDVYV